MSFIYLFLVIIRNQKTNSFDKKAANETLKQEDVNKSQNKTDSSYQLTGRHKFLIACGFIGLAGWTFKKSCLEGNLNNQVKF